MYDAKYFGNLFISTAKETYARRSYMCQISNGLEHTTPNSATVQNGMRLSHVSAKNCTVEISSEIAAYLAAASAFSRRQTETVSKFAKNQFVAALKRKFGKVTIKL